MDDGSLLQPEPSGWHRPPCLDLGWNLECTQLLVISSLTSKGASSELLPSCDCDLDWLRDILPRSFPKSLELDELPGREFCC